MNVLFTRSVLAGLISDLDAASKSLSLIFSMSLRHQMIRD